MPRSYPAEFRRKVVDLVVAGRPVAESAEQRTSQPATDTEGSTPKLHRSTQCMIGGCRRLALPLHALSGQDSSWERAPRVRIL